MCSPGVPPVAGGRRVLKLSSDEMLQVHLQVCQAYPEEGCGVLIGLETRGTREIERAIGIENQRGDRRHQRYLMTPEQFLDAERRARADSLEVLGFFHSHPDAPARPSSFDLEHAWDYYSYLIVSVSQGVVADTRAWRLRPDRSGFDPEPLELSDPTASHAGET